MKRIIIFHVIMLFAFIGVRAQTSVIFGYDAAGNRILRQIEVKKFEKSDAALFPDSLFAQLPNQSIEGVKVYPNPSSETVNIEFTSIPETKTEFKLSDMNGRLLEQGRIQSVLTPLNVKHLSKGAYLLLIIAGDKNEKIKIVKQ